jgi:hypothetical protein
MLSVDEYFYSIVIEEGSEYCWCMECISCQSYVSMDLLWIFVSNANIEIKIGSHNRVTSCESM